MKRVFVSSMVDWRVEMMRHTCSEMGVAEFLKLDSKCKIALFLVSKNSSKACNGGVLCSKIMAQSVSPRLCNEDKPKSLDQGKGQGKEKEKEKGKGTSDVKMPWRMKALLPSKICDRK